MLGASALTADVLRVLEQLEVHVGETPQPDRVQVATRGDSRAPLRGRVRVRPPGGRVPAGCVAGAVPLGRRPPRRSPPPAASCCPCARTGSTASATSSTSARRAPSACSCSARARATRRATRRRSPYFVDDVRELLGDGAEVRTRSLSEVTWTAEDAPTAAEWDRAHAASGPAAPRAGRAAHGGAAARPPGRARGRGRRRARELRRLSGEVARGGPPEAGRARAGPRGDGARLVRARGAPAHLPAPARRPASAA